MTLEGKDEVLRQLRRVGDDRALMRVASNAFRRSARRIRSEIVKTARTRGILRRIFGRKAAGLRRMVKLGRVKKLPANFEAPLTAGGLMAIQEVGGRFRPHVIKPKNAPKLIFRVNGRLIVTSSVNHPGASHPKMPAFWPAVKKAGPILRQDVADAVREHILRVSVSGA